MKVLLINVGYPPNTIGGAELMVQCLARGLVGAKVSAAVVSLSNGDRDEVRIDRGVRAYFVDAHPMRNLLLDPARTLAQRVVWHLIGEFNLWCRRKLQPILVTERPDVVHTHNLIGLSVDVWRQAARLGTPMVHTLHDYQLLCPRGTMFRGVGPCARQCRVCRAATVRRRLASSLPAAVIGISQFILAMHVDHGYFAGARRVVIPNAYQPQQQQALRSSLARSKPDGRLRIGFIGRLHPTKGLEELIAALARLPPSGYVARIAGWGVRGYEARLRARASGLPVEFLGWRPTEEFFDGIDVLVVPSVWAEPQGLILLEAMAFGVPVVYAARGGLIETGRRYPSCVEFDPAEEDGLAGILRYLMEHRPALWDLRDKARAAAAWSGVEAFIDRHVEVYRELLNHRRGSR